METPYCLVASEAVTSTPWSLLIEPKVNYAIVTFLVPVETTLSLRDMISFVVDRILPAGG
jgi:hypothetical protein